MDERGRQQRTSAGDELCRAVAQQSPQRRHTGNADEHHIKQREVDSRERRELCLHQRLNPVGDENRVTAFHQRLRRAIGLVVTVHGRSCMVARCGLLTRLPHTRPRAEPAGTARSIRFSEGCGCREPSHLMRQRLLVHEAAESILPKHAGGRAGTWMVAGCRRALIQ
jgi:hypothetical protein